MAVVTPYIRATRGAFKAQFLQMLSPAGLLFPFFNSLGPAITVGYIVGQSGNPTAVSYVFVGASLMALWSTGVFNTGWALSDEHWNGTLDLTMTSRTPVAVVLFGKALAIMASLLVSTAVVFLVVLAFAGEFTPVQEPVALFVSGLFALAAVIATSFVFAPFSFLHGARGGFFNAIMPAGTVVSGFLYPIGLLPASLEVVARLLPTSWAMEAVVRSVNGGSSFSRIAADWSLALLLIVAFLLLAGSLFKIAEKRVRVVGNLGVV
jgi:ABC-type multidrug transport system permease subunit